MWAFASSRHLFATLLAFSELRNQVRSELLNPIPKTVPLAWSSKAFFALGQLSASGILSSPQTSFILLENLSTILDLLHSGLESFLHFRTIVHQRNVNSNRLPKLILNKYADRLVELICDKYTNRSPELISYKYTNRWPEPICDKYTGLISNNNTWANLR